MDWAVHIPAFSPKIVESAGGRISGIAPPADVESQGPPNPLSPPVVIEFARPSGETTNQRGYQFAAMLYKGPLFTNPADDVEDFRTDHWHRARHGTTHGAFTAAALIVNSHRNYFSTTIPTAIETHPDDEFEDVSGVDLYSWRSSQVGVSGNDNNGFSWGTPLMAWAANDPRMGRSEFQRDIAHTYNPALPKEYSTRYFFERSDDPNGWTIEQWPWYMPFDRDDYPGGHDDEGNPAYPGLFQVIPFTVCPTWIVGSHVQPFDPGFEIREIMLSSSGLGSTGGGQSGYGDALWPSYHCQIREASLYWWSPNNPAQYYPHLPSETNWATEMVQYDYEDGTTKGFAPISQAYWAGTANYCQVEPYGFFPHVDAAYSADFPQGQKFPRRSDVGMSFTDTTTFYPELPNISVDAGFRLPGFEFRKPAAMLALPEGCTVVEATAEVRFTGCQRREYKAVWKRGANSAIGPNGRFPEPIYMMDTNFLGAPFQAASEYGLQIWQKSNEPGGEEYLTIYRRIGTASDVNTINWAADCTHLSYSEWNTHVYDTCGKWPAWNPAGDLSGSSYQLPGPRSFHFIPRVDPWIPGGSAYEPATVAPLAGVKAAFALVGLQFWGEYAGDGAETGRATGPSIKKFERVFLWADYDEEFPGYGDIDPWDNFYQAWRDRDYQAGLLTANPERIDLDNVRYRYLGRSFAVEPESGLYADVDFDAQVVPDSEWTTVDFGTIFAALLADVPREGVSMPHSTDETPATYNYAHHAYRIYPAGMADDRARWATHDGVCTNIAPFFNTWLPRVANMVDSGDVTGDFETRWEDILFQAFDTFEIRNVRATIRKPDTSEVEITIRTPWD